MGFKNIKKSDCPYTSTISDGRALVHILVEDKSTCYGNNLTACKVTARVEGVHGWLVAGNPKGILPYSFQFYNLDGQFKGGSEAEYKMSLKKTSTTVYVFSMYCNLVQPAYYRFKFIYYYGVGTSTYHTTMSAMVGTVADPSKPPMVVIDPTNTVTDAPITIQFNYKIDVERGDKYYIFPNGRNGALPTILTLDNPYTLIYSEPGIYTPEFGHKWYDVYSVMHRDTIVITKGNKPIPPPPDPPKPIPPDPPDPTPSIIECKNEGDKNSAVYTFKIYDTSVYDVVWDFGDGTTVTGINVSHTYKKSGKYIPSLRYKRK